MKRLILGLETGIDGGSIALLENERLIDSEGGAGDISKSEDLLLILDGLLKRNGIEKSEIGLIAISDAPGSVTGLRIGLALAKGLADALSIPLRRISILDAMASLNGADGDWFAVLQTKKNGIFYRENLSGNGEPEIIREIEFKTALARIKAKIESLEAEKISLVFNQELEIQLSEYFKTARLAKKIHFYPLNYSFGEIVGRAGAKIASDNENA